LVQLAAVYETFKSSGATLWAVSPQTVALNQGLVERRRLPFPVLADDDQAVIRAWGIFNAIDVQQRLIPFPATYVLGQDGRVAWYRLGLETRDRPTPAEVVTAVSQMARPPENH
jgi:peroxiredoxin